MGNERTVLLVGGAELPELRRAVESRGLDAVAFGYPSAMERVPDDPVLVERRAVDFARPMAVVRDVLEVARRRPLAAVVPVTEYGLLPAVMAARQLRLPSPPLAAVHHSRDKIRMRRVLAAAGVAQPAWALCRTPAEAEAFFARVEGPIIVKPSAGTGSEGITRVSSAARVVAAYERAAAAVAGGPVLCEEFVDGPEVSLEAVTVGGRFFPLALTDKETDEGFLEIGHRQPSMHPEPVRQAVAAAAERMLGALGLDDAVSHTEFRLGAAGPMPLETHSRMGGDFIHRLTEITTGVDLADVTLALALGERPEVAPRATGRGAAVRFLTGGRGRLEAVDAPAAAGGVETVEIHVRPGQVLGPCRSSGERRGMVLAAGATAAAAARKAAEHAGRIRFLCTPQHELEEASA